MPVNKLAEEIADKLRKGADNTNIKISLDAEFENAASAIYTLYNSADAAVDRLIELNNAAERYKQDSLTFKNEVEVLLDFLDIAVDDIISSVESINLIIDIHDKIWDFKRKHYNATEKSD